MKEKEMYREMITEMIKKIDNEHILGYMYIVIRDILKEIEVKKHE